MRSAISSSRLRISASSASWLSSPRLACICWQDGGGGRRLSDGFRITVDELRGLIDEGQKLLILDVRPKEARTQYGIIPGAVPAHPEDIDPVVTTYSRELEIVVYCACPNEASAAAAAKHLKQAGNTATIPIRKMLSNLGPG
jgi:rhodanese-related sulfurtransferase